MRKKISVLVAISLLMLACSSDNNSNGSIEPNLNDDVLALGQTTQDKATIEVRDLGTPTSVAIPVKLGEPFELEPGDKAALTGTGLQLTFNEVAYSSRCPGDVTCIWQGEAAIDLSVSDNNDKSNLQLKIDGLTGDLTGPTQHTVNYGGYNFTLLNLDPYPIEYPPDDYDPGPDRARILILAE